MTATATKRFVNLGKSRTQLVGPNGERLIVMPFAESLHPNTHKADALYVLEGEWWTRYVSAAGPLFPFPVPAAFGVESFPALVALRDDGERVELDGDPIRATAPGVAVAARMGTYRIAADVLTPDGKIKRTLPDGTIELLEDTPENRTQFADADPVNVKNQEIKDGIVAWLERMHVSTLEDFEGLSDEVMLKIPGVTSQSLPHIRANVRKMFGEAPASTTIDAVLSDEDDEGYDPAYDTDAEERPPVPSVAKTLKQRARGGRSQAKD
jgi:hypothetical protein